MLVLDKVAKAVFHVPGVAQVQTITRPLGTPLVPQLARVSWSAIQRGAAAKPDLPTGSGQRRPQAGRRTEQDDQHFEAAVRTAAAARRHHPRARPKAFATRSARSETCATRSRISTTSSGRCAAISTGRSTVTTFPSASRSDRCSTRSTASISSARSSKTSRLTLDKLDALQPKLVALIPPQIESQQTNRDLTSGELRHAVGHLRADRGRDRQRDRAGAGLRRREERRHVLPAARGVQQPRFQAWAEAVPVAGRQGRSHDHHA